MNDEEIRSTIEQIKAQVKAKPENKDKTEDEIDEMILDSFFQAYTKGEMTKEDLGGLAQILGYEFTEDFDQDPEAPADLGGGEGAGAEPEADAGAEPDGEGASAEDLEAVRTMEPGESAEDFKEKVDDVKAGEHVEGDDDESNNPDEVAEEGEDGEDEEDDEDAERAKASQLWKMNLNK